jgi:hypothetical protein
VAEPESKTGTTETKSGTASTVEQTTGKGDKTTESKTTEKTDTAGGKDSEKDLKEWHAKNPYEPPPGAIERKTSPATPELKEINDALRDNRKGFEDAVAKADADAVARKVPKKDYDRYRPKIIADIKSKFDHTQQQIEKQRDRVIDRQMAAEQREREKEARKITHSDEKEFKDTFKTRADEIMKAEGRTPSQKAEAKAALDRSVLRYAVSGPERKELENLAREVWRTNDHMDTEKAFDTVVGLTEIHEKGKGMNLQTGEKATSFRPVARTPKGDYVLLTPGGEKVTVNENVYTRIQNLHQQNWAQRNNTAKTAENEQAKQAAARAGLTQRAIKLLPPQLQLPIGAVTRSLGGGDK